MSKVVIEMLGSILYLSHQHQVFLWARKHDMVLSKSFRSRMPGNCDIKLGVD
jgi:hypothetical protein